MSADPVPELDETVHQRTRLGILTVLSEVEVAGFTHLRDTLALTDGNLSRHLRVLEEAGMVEIQKGFRGRTPHTTVSATPAGIEALTRYLEALETMIERLRAPGS